MKVQEWFQFAVRVLSFALLLAFIFSAQAVRSQADPTIAGPQMRTRQGPSPDEIKRDNERVKAMNKARAQRIKNDTDKLMELATQLKQYVDKTNENVLSVEVIKKADEIDKLAKSIRDKMKEDYRPPDPNIVP